MEPDSPVATSIAQSILLCLKRHYSLIILSFTTLLLFADQNLLAPNLTAAAREFGFDDNERDKKLGGDISLAFFLVGAPASFLIGLLVDRTNRVRLYAATVIVGESACAATYWTTTYRGLYITRMLTGISIGGTLPVVYSLLGDLYPASQRSLVSSVFTIAFSAGIALGQLVAGVVGRDGHWRVPFLCPAIPALVMAFLMLTTVPEPIRGGQEVATMKMQSLQKLQKSNGVHTNPEKTNAFEASWQKQLQTFTTPTVVLLILQGIPGCVPWGIVGVFLNDYLSQNKGLSIIQATTVLTALSVGAWVGAVVGGMIGQALYNYSKRLQPILVGTAVLLASIPLLYLINAAPAKGHPGRMFSLYFASSCIGFFAAHGGSNLRAVMQNVTLPETRGITFAVLNLADDLGRGLGPWFIALLIKYYGERRIDLHAYFSFRYFISSQPISSHLIPSHPISSHLIPSHLISSHLISSHLITSHLIPSHPISSHLIPSHPISSHLISSHLISSHLIASYLISSHFISSHLISSHLVSSHLISSHLPSHPILSHLISSHPISSHIISSHLVSSHLIPSHPISSNLIPSPISSHLIPSYLISSHLISSHLSSSHPISSHVISHLISSHLISSHLISAHLIPSHLISSHLISSHLISSHPISSHLISSHLPSHLTHLISSHLISSYLISSHLISSHPIPSHLIPSYLISSHLISCRSAFNVTMPVKFHYGSLLFTFTLPILSDLMLSYLTLSNLILPYLTSSLLISSYFTLPYLVLPSLPTLLFYLIAPYLTLAGFQYSNVCLISSASLHYCSILSYIIVSYRILSYLTLPYLLVLSCFTLPSFYICASLYCYPILSYRILSPAFNLAMSAWLLCAALHYSIAFTYVKDEAWVQSTIESRGVEVEDENGVVKEHNSVREQLTVPLLAEVHP
eukprot:g27029.t1